MASRARFRLEEQLQLPAGTGCHLDPLARLRPRLFLSLLGKPGSGPLRLPALTSVRRTSTPPRKSKPRNNTEAARKAERRKKEDSCRCHGLVDQQCFGGGIVSTCSAFAPCRTGPLSDLAHHHAAARTQSPALRQFADFRVGIVRANGQIGVTNFNKSLLNTTIVSRRNCQ